MTQQGNGHVAQHCQTVGRGTIQFTEAVTVTHGTSFQVFKSEFFDRSRLTVGADRF
jgi:hypothetical protein